MPRVLQQFNLLPDWTNLNKRCLLLIGSSVLGCSTAGAIYLGGMVSKPSNFKPKTFAMTFYTAKLYRLTIVFGVGLVSSIIAG